MTKALVLVSAVLAFANALTATHGSQSAGGPDTVVVHNGQITLHA